MMSSVHARAIPVHVSYTLDGMAAMIRKPLFHPDLTGLILGDIHLYIPVVTNFLFNHRHEVG